MKNAASNGWDNDALHYLNGIFVIMYLRQTRSKRFEQNTLSAASTLLNHMGLSILDYMNEEIRSIY